MRLTRPLAALLCLLLALPIGARNPHGFGTGFFTNFPSTENPLSQSGAWIEGGISSPRTNAQSTTGHAYGTMSSFDMVNFNDSIAVLAQNFPANQAVQGTIFNSSALSGQEVELILRGNISGASNTGYEVDLVLSNNSANLVSWNGPPNDFTILVNDATTNASFNNGDVWYAQIVGTVVTVKCNNLPVISYDTSGDTFKISSGHPGVGFWNQTGSSANSIKFGWSTFMANYL